MPRPSDHLNSPSHVRRRRRGLLLGTLLSVASSQRPSASSASVYPLPHAPPASPPPYRVQWRGIRRDDVGGGCCKKKEMTKEMVHVVRKPNAAARVVSLVFGAVGLTNRKASRALKDLGRALESVAERAESVSKLVHAVGRAALEKEVDEAMPPNNDTKWFSSDEPTMHGDGNNVEGVGTSFFGSDEEEEDRVESRMFSWIARIGAILLIRMERLPWWLIAFGFYIVGRLTSSPSRSQPGSQRTKRRRSTRLLVAGGAACVVATVAYCHVVRRRISPAGQRHPTAASGGAGGSSSGFERKVNFPHRFLAAEDASLVRETLSWLHGVNQAMWTGGHRRKSKGGLGDHLADKATALIVQGLRDSPAFSSTLKLQHLGVDLGSSPPRLRRVVRLRDTPRFLSDALGGGGDRQQQQQQQQQQQHVSSFVIEFEEWQFEPSRRGSNFLAAEMELTGSMMKYAVPHLGLVLESVSVGRSAAIVGIEFVPEYPFVKNAALAFLADDVPQLKSKAMVGAKTTSDLFEFEPFAQIVDDEFKRNLPIAPNAYAFDLGEWLTDCGGDDGEKSDASSPKNDATTARENDDERNNSTDAAAFSGDQEQLEESIVVSDAASTRDATEEEGEEGGGRWRSRRRGRKANNHPLPEIDEHANGPFAKLRRWVQRRRQQKAKPGQDDVAPQLTDSSSSSSATLHSRELEAMRRLDDERRKLLEAATAVRRERDKLVAAARSTRQAFSDRVFVAFKVQLAEELLSLGGVLGGSNRSSRRYHQRRERSS